MQTIQSASLHITDGESVAGTLKGSTVPGCVKIYGDLLYEGPAPAGLTSEGWLEARARFLSENGDMTADEARSRLASFEEALNAIAEYPDTVLWLDHRLSDQLILIRVLDWFSRRDLDPAKLSLICVGGHHGVERFVGLGQLTAEQLLSLVDTRRQVTHEQLRLGQQAWSAFTSANPTEIEYLIRGETAALPFLGGALRRHLEQFPSVENGLSRTERQALLILRERPRTASRLFFELQKMEDPLFMGDGSFFRVLMDLASARHPLIQTVDHSQSAFHRRPTTPVAISEAGLRVLEGQDDHIRLNGIDRWIGGVHMRSDEAVWRWDRLNGRLLRKF